MEVAKLRYGLIATILGIQQDQKKRIGITILNNHIEQQRRPLVVSAHRPGRHDGHAAAHDHGPANGHYRGLRGPSILRAIPSLRDSGRSGDASSRPPHTEDAPNVPAPTCSGDPPVSNILRSTRIPGPKEVRALHKRLRVAQSRCTPKSVLKPARQSQL